MLKVKRLKSQIIQMSMRRRKPEGLNRMAIIGYGHLSLRDEDLTFNYNYFI
jgi:hypothetical protein